MNDYEQQMKRLAKAISKILPKAQSMLEEKKQYAKDLLKHDNFIWHILLTSFATLGRSAGYDGLIRNLHNYELVKYETLKPLSDEQRHQSIKTALNNAKVRFHRIKARQLTYNYALIEKMGGAKMSESQLFSQDGREGKIRFLRQFRGIGPKYSRNIMMDIYHSEFRQSIAVDSRLKDILNELGILKGRYEDFEQFFLDVAHECNLDGWEIDRILYNFKDDVLKLLRSIE